MLKLKGVVVKNRKKNNWMRLLLLLLTRISRDYIPYVTPLKRIEIFLLRFHISIPKPNGDDLSPFVSLAAFQKPVLYFGAKIKES